jgi:hypothetical protein
MSQAQWINSVLFFLWPVMIGIAFWLFHYLIQRLPAHTRLALQQFALLVVKKVEQEGTTLDNAQKKAQAVQQIMVLFREFGLPVPPPDVIDIAIEAAVFEINQLIGKDIVSGS